jgi:diadenosine tetraphosphate (Ap4A) HIT family hydrolase
MTTVFAQIIAGKIPSKKYYEDEEILVIQDIHPQAKVHLLIIPKEPFESLQKLPKNKTHLVAKVVDVAQEMAKKFHVENSYRLLTNNGIEAGQTVFHLHFHLIGGEPLGPMA